jgi:hypothetical protein
MFTARTVVVIVALAATSAVARPARADERIPTIKSAPTATASLPIACRVTAQKVTEDPK